MVSEASETTVKSGNVTARSMAPMLWPFVRPYCWRLAAFLAALVVTSVATLLVGQGLKMVIDQGLIAQSSASLRNAIVFLGGLSFVMAGATALRFYMISWLGERVSADIRNAVFTHIIGLEPEFFDRYPSGNIMARLTSDTTLLQSIVGSGLSLALRSSVTLVGALVMLFVTNIQLALIVLVGIPISVVPLLLLGRRVRQLSRQSQDSLADVGSYAGEIIQQIKVVQSYTREAQERIAFGSNVERAFDIAKGRIQYRSGLTALVILIIFSVLSVMVWTGGTAVVEGRLSGGDFGAFIFYAMVMAMSVATLSEVYGELQRAAGATERLMELLATESAIQSSSLAPDSEQGSCGALCFNNVTFAYASRRLVPAVCDFSLRVEPGEVIALVGPSGAGKTTLFDLIQRFYDPIEGCITLAGYDLKDYPLHTLRAQIGVVQQQPVLFSGTIKHNIGYGRSQSTDQALEQEIIEVAKSAQAHDFIMQCPQGYDSQVGEQGVRLSGGQKQRIAIARVLLKDPSLLLLDEATSALDSESEQAVQTALTELMAGRTTLIIAHRLATVMHANRIAVVDSGRLVALGTHQQLLAESPLYSRLARLQFNGGEYNKTLLES